MVLFRVQHFEKRRRRIPMEVPLTDLVDLVSVQRPMSDNLLRVCDMSLCMKLTVG